MWKEFVFYGVLFCTRIDYAEAKECCRTALHSNKTDDAIILEVINVLNWTFVTFLHNSKPDVTQVVDNVVTDLHSRGMTTCLLEDPIDSEISDTVDRHATSNCFVVLGDHTFLYQLLNSVVKASDKRQKFLFQSQWLVRLDENHLNDFTKLATYFQNMVVLVQSETGSKTLWTVRHARNGSHLTMVSTLVASPSSFSSPSSSFSLSPPAQCLVPLSRPRLLPNLSDGLGGRTLKVALKEIDPYVIFDNTTASNNANSSSGSSNGAYKGVLIDLLKELSRKLNFRYTLHTSRDDKWGNIEDNGQWSGLIRMLTTQEADVALCPCLVTEDRSRATDPVILGYDKVVIFFYYEWTTSSDVTGSLKTFALFAAISLPWVLFLMLLFERIQWRFLDQPPVFLKLGDHIRRVLVNVEIVLTGLLRKPTSYESGSRAGHVLRVVWLFLGILVTSLYGGEMASSLTTANHSLPFSSLAQLLQQTTYTWGTLGGSAEESLLMETKNADIQRFYQRMKEFNKTDPDVFSSEWKVQKAKVMRGHYAVFQGSIGFYDSMVALRCDIRKIPESYMELPLGLFLQKGSPYTDMFTHMIMKTVDAGLLEYWKQKWAPKKQQCNQKVKYNVQVMNVVNLTMPFILVAVGLGVAVVALGLEACIKVFNEKKRNLFP